MDLREYQRAYYRKNREKLKKQRRKWYVKNRDRLAAQSKARRTPEKMRAYHDRSKYGLGPGERAEMFRKQRGRCAICRKKKRLVMDHDHKTGRVRGLLCQSCNIGVGVLDTNPKKLARALAYLKEN